MNRASSLYPLAIIYDLWFRTFNAEEFVILLVKSKLALSLYDFK